MAEVTKNVNIYNRAEIIDRNFLQFVKEGRLPEARTHVTLSESGLSSTELTDLFESQIMSRILDIRAREMKNENSCFYTIGSSGHEGNAIIGKAFRTTDMAFLHYRSGALMIQRSKLLPGSTPLYDNLLSFVAASDEPISGGRHKVFGSVPLMVPPQTSTIASHLPKAVGAAISISRAKDLQIKSVMPHDSVVLCSFGDASSNHATAQVAFNTASQVAFRNVAVPIVFICEDNGIGISVPTPEGWIQKNFSTRPEIKYFWADGLNLLHFHKIAKEAEQYTRTRKKPAFLHMSTVRLLAHAGSDPEWTYNTMESIESNEFNDPLLHSARLILENGILSSDDIISMYESIRLRVRKISEEVIHLPKLTTPKEVRASLVANRNPRSLPEPASEEDRARTFGRDFDKLSNTPLHMAKLINYCIADLMLRYKNTLVFGEDVAQKGGVYNVTDGLFKKFGPRRVFNSILDETSIIGNAIGFAHNGFLPMPEIQFLAYFHNAEDQIRGEASTLAFFSQGQYTNPMVLRIAGLAYQKGFGGHFHNDNSLTIFRDIPGLIVAVPSNGADAVKMLRACVRAAETEGRVVIFIEPIALYMTKDLHIEGDKGWSFNYPPPTLLNKLSQVVENEIAVGDFGIFGEGEDVLIITYGNGYFYSRQAEKELREKLNIASKIIDLRWIAPIHWDALMEVVRKFNRVCIVEECRKTGSLSEQLVAGIVEKSIEGSTPIPKIKVISADDCFIPLGVAAAAGLPKKAEIIAGVLELIHK
jgi:2-oxoisovalerate dehydrogenase E1 component